MRSLARLGALAATSALTVSGLVAVTATSATAAPAPDPAGVTTGASWLAGQLTNGVLHQPDTGFGASDDYGSSIDAGLALVAVNQQSAAVQSISTKLAANIATYATTAGAAAKSAVFVDATNGNPAAFGGTDLVTQVNNAVATTAPIAGRLQNSTTGTDFANSIVQAYAASVLTQAGASNAANATAFLLEQQCPNGGFRLSFTADKTASGQSCTDNADAQLDSTSIALRMLKTLPSGTTGVAGAITAATTFLQGKQQPTGAWGGDPFTSAANANSTGLAAWALGDTTASANGATWLRNHQITYYDQCTKMASQIGAVAYDASTLSSLRGSGYPAAQYFTARSATAQALPALQYLKDETVNQTLAITGPSGFLKGGSFQTFRVTGGVTGEELCLTTLTAYSGSTVGTSPWSRSLYMAAGPISRSVAVRDRDGHKASLAVNVLGKKTIGVSKLKKRFKRSSFARIYVYGLPYREHVRIYFRGQLKATGTTDAYGRFVRGIWTGRKLGKGVVRVYGQFGDIRKGSTTIKVVR